MDEHLGRRFEQAFTLIMRMLVVIIIGLAWGGCFARPRSQHLPSLHGSIRIHSGSASAFRDVVCHEGLEAIDRDETRDVAAELRRRLKSNSRSLDACRSNDEPKLVVSYRGGRGVCVDCGTTGDDWSGFAFITVNDVSGKEIARAEWTGGGGSNGIQLIDRFADDLLVLVNKTK